MAKHEMPAARNLPGAANADNSLEGYAAINGSDNDDEVREIAYRLYEERGGEDGHEMDDWLRAEEEVRRRRPNGF